MIKNRILVKLVVVVLIIFITTVTFAQQDAAKTQPYSPATGRIISSEILKKYTSVYSAYTNSVKPLPDSKNLWIDFNDLGIIYNLSTKFKIEDPGLTDIINNPANKELIDKILYNGNSKSNKPFAVPATIDAN